MQRDCTTWLGIAVCLLYEWQTLLTGLLALAAAWLTVRKMNRQIEVHETEIANEEKNRADARRSKGWAARAAMPDALSGLSAFASKCMGCLQSEKAAAELPTQPTSAIDAIKAAVEHVDPLSAKKLFELIVHYQIHNSRLWDLDRYRSTQVVQAQYDVVYLQALINRLYSFARNEVETVPDAALSRQDMITAFRACVGVAVSFGKEPEFRDLMERIERRHADP